MNKPKMNEEKEDTNPYFEFYNREIQIIKDSLSEEEKNDPEFQPVIIEFEKPIKEITEIFSSQGHSGGSAPFYSGALSRAIKNILSFTPLSPITGEDSEWFEHDEQEGEIFYQNNRLSSVFKNTKLGKAHSLDAIVWQGEEEYDTFTGTVEGVSSSQNIKFPFTPKTFYINVLRIFTDVETADSFEIHDEPGKFYHYEIKDRKQLEEVFKYYEEKKGNRKEGE